MLLSVYVVPIISLPLAYFRICHQAFREQQAKAFGCLKQESSNLVSHIYVKGLADKPSKLDSFCWVPSGK
jgi:hypothetical protein